MSINDYQHEVKDLLSFHFDEEIIIEWRAKMNKGLYSPRVDIAVGPFAIEDGLRLTYEHINLIKEHEPLFRSLAFQHLVNLNIINEETNNEERQGHINSKMDSLRETNLNGRCFLAIEIENKISRKHLMGGAVNSAVLGKIGIAVGFSNEKHKAFLNLYRYFEFLRSVDKPTFNTSNLLIISSDQLLEILF